MCAAGGLALAMLAAAIAPFPSRASPPQGDPPRMSCAGAVYEVLGESLLDRHAGGDAIRLGDRTVAVRSGCEEAPMRYDEVDGRL